MIKEGQLSYEACRGPCPKCGYKFASIEQYDMINAKGKYRVKLIRCRKAILDKSSRTQKRRVGGCGEVTIMKKKMGGKNST